MGIPKQHVVTFRGGPVSLPTGRNTILGEGIRGNKGYNAVLDAACHRSVGYTLFLQALHANFYDHLSLGCPCPMSFLLLAVSFGC